MRGEYDEKALEVQLQLLESVQVRHHGPRRLLDHLIRARQHLLRPLAHELGLALFDPVPQLVRLVSERVDLVRGLDLARVHLQVALPAPEVRALAGLGVLELRRTPQRVDGVLVARC